jgi:mannose-6-phosphate isomerase-like protein (cupin superfamily)
MRVSVDGNVPPIEDSALAVETFVSTPGEALDLVSDNADTIVFSSPPDGLTGHAELILAGEDASLATDDTSLVLRATIGPDTDRHAPLGRREHGVAVRKELAESATGKRTFQVLFGPHNGSTRATMFVGYVPPGAAPWHFHLYDEIVWIWRGEGRFHTSEGAEPIGSRSAFRIRPREVHVVENTSRTEELVVVGLFTPAGSPSAAYLAEDPQ